jgi:ankyrin repeat protein
MILFSNAFLKRSPENVFAAFLSFALIGLVITGRAQSLDQQLVTAAVQGNVTNVELLLKEGANPNYMQPFPGSYGWAGYSPLFGAIFPAHSVACVKVLLAAGADPFQVYKKNPWMFPFQAACQDGMTNKEILELLLEHTKQLPTDDDGRLMEYVFYPLIRRGEMQTVERLEKLGAHLGVISGGGKAAFMAAAEAGRYEEAEKWLNDYSDDYSHATNKVDVMWAVDRLGSDRFFDDDNLARIIKHAHQLGINFFEIQSPAPWSRSVVYRCPKTAEALGCPQEELAKIAPRSKEDLMLAASCNSDSLPVFTNLVQECLRDAPDRKAAASLWLFEILSQRFPLFSIQLDALKYLHSQGADVNYECKTNPEGLATPLEAAVLRGSLDVMQWLVEQGADVNRVNSENKMTALEFAVIWGRENIVNWLLANGTHIQEKRTGRPLLVTALRGLNPDSMFAILVKAGADPYLRNENKKSAMDILADRLDIMRLRKFDNKGVYHALVKEYTPPANSPFIGIWSNGKGEFQTASLILNDEGMSIIGTSIMPMGFFPWRTIDKNHAAIEIVQMPDRNRPTLQTTNEIHREELVVEWITQSNALQVVTKGGLAGELLKKQPGVPPKVEEIQNRTKH